MAVDQREALIAAVRAQVEKERAEKQKKLEREQEAMAFSKKGEKKKTEEKKQFKTLSPEELARIEEKKRRKRAEELGIDLDAQKEPEIPGFSFDEEGADDQTVVLTADMKPGEGLGGAGLGGGLGSTPTGGLGSTPSGGGLGANVDGIKTFDKAAQKNAFSADGKTISDESGWVSDQPEPKKSGDDLDSIIPTNRETPSNDVDAMYDIDDEFARLEQAGDIKRINDRWRPGY